MGSEKKTSFKPISKVYSILCEKLFKKKLLRQNSLKHAFSPHLTLK
jgi:hypothetical protein